MEIKKVTRKSLTFSSLERDLLENTANLLSKLYGEDVIDQIFYQVIDEATDGSICDFEDMANALRRLANNEYIIKEEE